MSNETKFIFSQEGLPQLRSELKKTVQEVIASQKKLNATTKAGDTKKTAGSGKDAAAAKQAYSTMEQSVNKYTKSLERNLALQKQLKTTQADQKQRGVRQDTQTRDSKGRFSGHTQASLEAEKLRIVASLKAEGVKSQNVVNSALVATNGLLDKQVQSERYIAEQRALGAKNAVRRSNAPAQLGGGGFGTREGEKAFDEAQISRSVTALASLKQRLQEVSTVKAGLAKSAIANPKDAPEIAKQIEMLEWRSKVLQGSYRQMFKLKGMYEQTAQALRIFDSQQGHAKSPKTLEVTKGDGSTAQLSRAQALNELEAQRAALIQYSNFATRAGIKEQERLGITAETSVDAVIRMRTELAHGVNVPGNIQAFATGEFDSFVQGRISKLQNVVTKTTEAMAAVRSQVAKDYPKAVSEGSFDAFDKAETQLNRIQSRIVDNDRRIEAMRTSSSTARDAVTRKAFGLEGGAEPKSDKEKSDAEEINNLLTQRRLLRNQELDKITEMQGATAQIQGIQKGQNLGLKDINSLLGMQKDAIAEIVTLEGSGFMNTFQQSVPGLKDDFAQLKVATAKFEQAVTEAGGGKSLAAIKTLETRLRRLNEELNRSKTPAARADVKGGTTGISQTEKDLVAEKGKLTETLLNKPAAQEAANGVYEVINGMHQKLVKSAAADPVRMVPPTQDLIGQLGVVDRVMLDTFSGMKRRFLTTFQFMFSGAIIFGIQRIAREFVQAAIEVERAFKDISTALHFDIPQQEDLANKLFGDFDFTRSLENVRRQVLYIANDLNVLPAEANEAAFQMVSRFGDVESAMIATEAQLLATKVATIDQSEVLRALTAVGDTFAQSLKLEGSQMDRNTAHAKLYMTALDGATILQQKFGIAIEDTLEGAGQMGEVFRQLGFDILETEAAVALVSQRTGQEGSATADRLARSIGSIGTDKVKKELLQLAKADPDLQLSYEDFLGPEGGANVIRKLEDQMGQVSQSTANRVREIIGGRREAAFVAAYFGTSAERKNAAEEMAEGVGAARSRYDLLTQTVSESLAGVIAQFQSLAQNLSTVGFLTPMKIMLSILEQVLSVINRVIQSVSSLVLAFNRVKLPFTKLGLGDILITMVSLSLAAQAFGNSFARIAMLISTLAKENRIAELFRMVPFLSPGMKQAVPKQSVSKFASVAVGASATAPITTRMFSGFGKEMKVFGTSRGPFAAAALGAKGLKNGLIQLTASMRLARSAAVLEASVEGAAAAARTSTAGTADAYRVYSAAATDAGTATKGMSSGMLGMAKTIGIAAAAIIAAMAAWDVVRGVFADSPNFWGDSTVDRGIEQARIDALAREERGEPEVIKQLQTSMSKRSVDARNDLNALDAQYNESQGLFEGFVGWVRDSWVRQGIQYSNAISFGAKSTDRKDFQFLAEGNRYSAAQDIQHQMRGLLESKVEELTKQIESDSISAGDKVDLLALRRELYKRIDQTVDVNSDEFKRQWEELVGEVRDEMYDGLWGSIEGYWKFGGLLGADPGGDREISEEALRRLQAGLAEEQERLVNGISIRLTGMEAVREILEQKGYEEQLKDIKDRFKAGTIDRPQQTKEFAETWIDAMIGMELALTPDEEGNVNEDEAKKWESTIEKAKADYIESLFGFADDLHATGYVLADLKAEIAAGEKALAEAIAFRIETGLGSERYERELKLANDDLKRKVAETQLEVDFSFVAVGMLKYAADAAKQYEYLKEKQQLIIEKWNKIKDDSFPSITNINPYGEFAPEMLEILEEFLQNRAAMWAALQEMYLQEAEMANKSGVLRGDQLVIIDTQISALRQTITELKKNGKDIEAFQLEKQVADLERQRTQEIIRRNQIRIEAQIVQGDQLSAGRAAIEIARQTVKALKDANVIEEEKIAAQTALNNAEWDYFQTVLHYSDLLRRQGSDVTNPLVQAKLDAEAAAEEYANAEGEIEKLEAEGNYETSNAAYQRAFYDDRQKELQWMYDSEQVGKSGYIAALRKLQQGVDRSTYQGEEIWREIERTIMGLVDEVEQGFNIPAEIRMPTLFEVRRAVQADAMGVNYQDNRQQDINIIVDDSVALQDVLDAVGISDASDLKNNAPGGASIFYGGV